MTRRDDFELPASAARIGRAVDAELAFHIEERVRELVAAGIDCEAAHARATREFGDLDGARRDLRRIGELAAHRSFGAELAAESWTDLTRTVRGLAQRPGYALAAILTLALGIGANSAMFALVDRLLLSAPPFIEDADAVVHLRVNEAMAQSGRITWHGAPYGYYRALAESRLDFDVAGAMMLSMTIRVNDDIRPATVLALTPGYFSLLGARPEVGRFVQGQDVTDERAVVVSHALWTRDLGRASDVLDRDIILGNQRFRIVGVAPQGFTGADIHPVDAWIALGPTTPGLPHRWLDSPDQVRIPLIARPHDGVSRTAVAGEATRRYRAWASALPNSDSTARVLASSLTPGRTAEGNVTPESRVALWLQGVSILVLLIAVANVANLLVIRAIDRRRETAVSMALGVSRLRLVRHAVLESLVIGTTAAIVAAFLVRWSGPSLWTLLLPMGAELPPAPWKDAVIVALLALGSTLAMTVVPAMIQLRTPTVEVLQSGGRGSSRRGSRVNDVLVVVQVACALVLLVGSGLFVRSLVRLADFDRGFELDRVVAVRIDQVEPTSDSTVIDRRLEVVDARVAALPGVQRTARSLTAPYRPSLGGPVFLPGHDKLPGVGPNGLGYPSYFAVNSGFFGTMGLTILRGRNFAESDAATSPLVIMVDATMARTFWPNADAIGRCVRLGADTAPCRTVVGIVQDTERSPLGNVRALRYYVPITQASPRQTDRYVFARTAAEPSAMVPAIRAAVTAAAPGTFIETFPLLDVLEPYTKPWRLGRAVFVVFGVLATVIATIGLYGVIAFGVVQRQRELGIRLALGATRSTVLRLVMLGAARRLAIGALVGVGGAMLLGRQLGSLLFQTSPTEALVFAGSLAVVVGATVVASALPAWRAVRVDPTVSLRAE